MTQDDRRRILIILASAALIGWWIAMTGIWEHVGRLGTFCLIAMVSLLVLAIDDHAHKSRRASCRPRRKTNAEAFRQLRACLKHRFGEEAYVSWFNALEFESFDGRMVTMSVPVKFLRNHILDHYFDDLQDCCLEAFPASQYARIVTRTIGEKRECA